MSASPPNPTTPSTALNLPARLELANQLFREFHTTCFWHCPRDLAITEETLPIVVNGLRKHRRAPRFLAGCEIGA